MALSTRAKLAGLGGALALGVLGATGVAYAGGEETATPRYVTTVDGTEQAPADGRRTDGKDCPEGAGGRGGEAAPTNPADA